ncbi:uncharacterized protein [Diabrotica undecimpunctata]|uniref:uncharacterized protein n=1 Tax=Diabrotica undecimpunctata TaxID=50387 RepID=UPI003B641B69
MGDCNAKLGKEDSLRELISKHSLHDTTNDNGHRLTQFAISYNMIVKSTQFERKNIYKVTWAFNDGRTRNQIDHVLIDKLEQQEKREIWNIEALQTPNKELDYQVAISNRFQLLREEEHNVELEQAWQQVALVIQQAAKETVGKKRTGPKRKWFDKACEEILEIKMKKD